MHIHPIELKLREINQLFNTLDPSPFNEKDLDHDAEEFILSSAQEFHRHDPVNLVIHLEKVSEQDDPQALAEEAVHHYFDSRREFNRLEFRRLMKQGRASLFVGIAFLATCFLVGELIIAHSNLPFASFIRESLTIAGWVAMWKPLEIFLYDWWPLRRQGQIFEKLSRMPVEIQKRE